MLGLYLFATVVGGGLLLVSLLAGSDNGVDQPTDAPDHDFGGHDVDASTPGLELLVGLFRPRNLIFFLATFGITGTLLTALGSARSLVLPLALGMGGAAWVTTYGVFTWLRRTNSAGDLVSDEGLEGHVARVTLPIHPGERGRVVCLVGGQEVYLVARLAEGAREALPPGAEFVLWRVANGEAEVKQFPPLDAGHAQQS